MAAGLRPAGTGGDEKKTIRGHKMKQTFIFGFVALILLLAFCNSSSAAELTFEGAIIQESYDQFDTDKDFVSGDYWSFTVNTPGTVTIDVLS
jgi:major membrane immunogen (membrane-anchored lipoprotein)